MRAEIRRIDLTTQPVTVEAWPSLDWLSAPPVDAAATSGPKGRGGLWDAMAHAVQRAREASTAPDNASPAADAPHLAYLARVAAGARAASDGVQPRDRR